MNLVKTLILLRYVQCSLYNIIGLLLGLGIRLYLYTWYVCHSPLIKTVTGDLSQQEAKRCMEPASNQ